MDNHPIPQDVTNFQFRLIGDMTIKQFAYLAGGITFGFACFALPISWLFKIPIALTSGLFGATLAFLPYEGRPSDVMLMHFLKALITPNQYVYQKITSTPTVQAKVQVVNAPSTEEKKKEKIHEKIDIQSATPVAPAIQTIAQPQVNELQEYAKSKQMAEAAALVASQTKTTPQVVEQKEQKLVTKAATLQSAITKAQEEEAHASTGSAGAEKAHEKVLQLQSMLEEAMVQKQELEKQFILLQQSLHQTRQALTPTTVAVPQTPEAKETTHVRKIPKQLSKSVGLPITPDVPNLITGIVKDPRGNVLPNILIEVKDKDQNPVRAFKTNNLGQFASATPLLNGTYTVTFEDPQGKNSFETVEIVADGQILLPIEVLSVDQREKLRQELFG